MTTSNEDNKIPPRKNNPHIEARLVREEKKQGVLYPSNIYGKLERLKNDLCASQFQEGPYN